MFVLIIVFLLVRGKLLSLYQQENYDKSQFYLKNLVSTNVSILASEFGIPLDCSTAHTLLDFDCLIPELWSRAAEPSSPA